jgi:hypothetical protein
MTAYHSAFYNLSLVVTIKLPIAHFAFKPFTFPNIIDLLIIDFGLRKQTEKREAWLRVRSRAYYL